MKKIARIVLALFFVAGGLNHFRDPAIYLGMMPPWLPQLHILHLIAGAAEVLGGLGLLVPAVRRFSAWGLIVLLVAVFPANLHVALQGNMPGTPFGPAVLWARLPFQAVFIFAVWWSALKAAPAEPKKV